MRSARLRTLPLSLAGVGCGLLLATPHFSCHGPMAVLLTVLVCLTTSCLQVLSNLSNELGDYRSGTDGASRLGPAYGIAVGGITPRQLEYAIRCLALAAALFGTLMVWTACGTLFSPCAVALLLLGAAAIWAAIHYTLGSHPYGYRGLGDLFVFLFFGLVAVCGAYFVATLSFSPSLLLPGSALGVFSIGVLNVNNMRDMESDRATRLTVPILLGLRRAKRYHLCLVISGWICLLLYTLCFSSHSWTSWLYVITVPCYVVHLRGVMSGSGKELDPMLPLLVISTFATAILFALFNR